MIVWWQVIILVAILLVFAVIFALAFIQPFTRHLDKRLDFDRERSEACHNFQKELNRQTLIGFEKTSRALDLNTQVLNSIMERMGAPVLVVEPPPIDRPKAT